MASSRHLAVRGGLTRNRKITGETGALADLGLEGDEAMVPPDEPNYRRETKPGAFALWLGGEEWVEESRQNLRRDPRAGIADADRHVVAEGRHVTHHGWDRFGQSLGPDANGERAAVGHGISGVHTEIHHDLVNLSRIH